MSKGTPKTEDIVDVLRCLAGQMTRQCEPEPDHETYAWAADVIEDLRAELNESLSHEGAKDLALEELEEHDYLACNCVYQVLIALDDEVDQSEPVDLTVIPHRVLALRRYRSQCDRGGKHE